MASGNSLNRTLKAFIETQPMFFVATSAPEGRVNMSPKGMDSLRILSDNRVIWLNLTGSGNETAAHLLESERMTLMFCAFEGDAKILRLYGQARAIHPRDDEWEVLAGHFPKMAGSRQVFDMTVDTVQISCGSGVPFMTFEKGRGEEEMEPHWAQMGDKGVKEYWERRNALSIDGKPTGIFGKTADEPDV